MAESERPSSLVSRVDLLRFMDSMPEALGDLASIAGFEKQPTSKPRRGHAQQKFPKKSVQSQSAPTQQSRFDALFQPILVDQFKPRDFEPPKHEEDWLRDTEPMTPAELAALNQELVRATPDREPLVEWSRLWPYLKAQLGSPSATNSVDLEKLTRQVANLDWPSKLPRTQRLNWSHNTQLLLDLEDDLKGYCWDLKRLKDQLNQLLGHSSVRYWYASEGILGVWREVGRPGTFKEWPICAHAATMLVISDLGQLSGEPERIKAWQAFGMRLKQAGIQARALVPLARSHWHPDLVEHWAMACWDREHPLPMTPQRAGFLELDKPGHQTNVLEQRLLACLSLASLIRVPLVRTLRRLLADQASDPGVEARVFRHPHVQVCGDGWVIKAQWVDHHRHYFRAGIKPHVQNRVARLLIDHHADLPAEDQWVLQQRLHDLLDEKELSYQAYLPRLAKGLQDKAGAARDWIREVSWNTASVDWDRYEVLAALWVKLRHRDFRFRRCVAPAGLDVQRYAYLFAGNRHTGRYSISMRTGGAGGRLVLAPATEPSEENERVIPVLSFLCGQDFVTLDREVGGQELLSLDEEQPLPFKDAGQLTITSDRGCYAFKSLNPKELPTWAQGWGCDAGGTYLEVTEGESKRKVYWLAAGPYQLFDRVGASLGSHVLQQGAWMDASQYDAWQTGGLQQPDWAEQAGVDQYGFYADWVLPLAVSHKSGIRTSVNQRFRWIMPGVFQMGSPDEEPGRYKDEGPQHQVTISRGYWLAETACTQALWQALMGGNPSKFKGMERPVEAVSWDDVQTFLTRLLEVDSRCGFRLPSEAEWEYACRAGTTTTFSFGETITADQVNYNASEPLEGSPSGVYRRETVPVKSLPPNRWGLYEMHGNVWEWCADDWDAYASDAAIDPRISDDFTERVWRGGSWSSSGGIVRSAIRGGVPPGSRFRDVGFRMVPGPAQQAGRGRTAVEERRRSGQDLAPRREEDR